MRPPCGPWLNTSQAERNDFFLGHLSDGIARTQTSTAVDRADDIAPVKGIDVLMIAATICAQRRAYQVSTATSPCGRPTPGLLRHAASAESMSESAALPTASSLPSTRESLKNRSERRECEAPGTQERRHIATKQSRRAVRYSEIPELPTDSI